MDNDTLKNLKLLSIKDLAKVFNISDKTVYRLVDSRRIPFYKISGVLRFEERDILEYLSKNRINSIK